MHTRSSNRIAIALFVLASIVATMLSAVMVWGASLTALLVPAALAGSAILLAGAHALREAVREWRWNAGHRLR